jgi:glycosyltransferase involved in cell wall biosynthesis
MALLGGHEDFENLEGVGNLPLFSKNSSALSISEMRIAYFMNFYPVESQIVAEDEMVEMVRLGHQVYVFPIWGALEGDWKIPEELRGRVFRFFSMLSYPNLVPNLLYFSRFPLRYLRFIHRARAYIGLRHAFISAAIAHKLHRLKIERIHTHFASTAALRAMLIGELLGAPYSCTGHGSDVLLYQNPHLSEMIRRARPFITISEYNRRHLMKLDGCAKVDIKIVHCGVDLERFKPVEKKNDRVPVILSVSWLRKIKGIEYLVEACAILKKRGHSFRCMIIGGGEERENIERMIQDCDLSDRVVIEGAHPRAKIVSLLGTADIFVLPSLSEGIPVALMEAMAMELPVVATRITGIPELVTDGESGFLVEPRNPEEIAGKVEKIFESPELGRRMGRKAREKVNREFDLKKNVKLLEELFLQNQESA